MPAASAGRATVLHHGRDRDIIDHDAIATITDLRVERVPKRDPTGRARSTQVLRLRVWEGWWQRPPHGR